jgi:hypothetical protein
MVRVWGLELGPSSPMPLTLPSLVIPLRSSDRRPRGEYFYLYVCKTVVQEWFWIESPNQSTNLRPLCYGDLDHAGAGSSGFITYPQATALSDSQILSPLMYILFLRNILLVCKFVGVLSLEYGSG